MKTKAHLQPERWFGEIETPHGKFRAAFSRVGLAALDFPGRAKKSVESSDAAPAGLPRWICETRDALNALFAGREPKHFPPLDLSEGTEFQCKVWRALREISLGETTGYGELARAIGHPRASRAVGAACGANPIPILVPCHRVIASSGRLGGYSSGAGWKPRLLAMEGIEI